MSSLSDIQARLAERKRAAEEARLSGAGSSKRWRRKGDVDAAAAAAYHAKQAAKARADAQKSRDAEKEEIGVIDESVLSSDANERSKDGDVSGPAAVEVNGSRSSPPKDAEREPPPLEKDEVVRRLRALGEPATFYGETDWERFRRLRDLGLAKEAEGRGQKNVFQDKMREIQRIDKMRQAHEYAGAEFVEPVRVGKGGAASSASNGTSRKGADSGDCDANEQSLKRAMSKEAEADSVEPSCNEQYVLREIQRVISLWEGDVDGMAPDMRRTNKGRTAAVTLEQTKEWLKPLQKQLKRRRLQANILNALVNIFRAVAEREYVKANSFYYEQLAIGNAPWPMGATMVGIHARAAREKIGEDKIAHVMNDEQSRKYIQAVKRLVSKCQAHFPTVPSKMISS